MPYGPARTNQVGKYREIKSDERNKKRKEKTNSNTTSCPCVAPDGITPAAPPGLRTLIRRSSLLANLWYNTGTFKKKERCNANRRYLHNIILWFKKRCTCKILRKFQSEMRENRFCCHPKKFQTRTVKPCSQGGCHSVMYATCQPIFQQTGKIDNGW